MSVLIIAEKPSVAKGIAAVVGAKTSKGAYLEGGGYFVSWCFGHLVGLKQPNDYENSGWSGVWNFAQLPMIPQDWEFKLKTNKGVEEQFTALENLMRRSDVTEIICATDADREGECIFRYVYYFAGCKKRVNRLWLSNLEQSAIRKALNSVKPMRDYDNLYSAGYCRAKADWLIGMNGSRLFSLRYGTRLTLGRVQTPTLAMIVKRDFEVDNFVKQKYFTVDLDCGGFTLSSARIDDEQAALDLAAKCNGANAVIQEVKREVKNEKPPKLYDLTSLQRDANKAYGYTAKQSLDYTQSLYEKQLVTYPRTDSQYLPDNMAQETLDVLRICDKRFGFNIEHTPDISRCINNEKVTGHHAIIPTASVQNSDLSALNEGEKNVLMLVVTRLIVATAENHRYESVKVTAQCCETEFTASGRTEIAQGWRKYAKTETSEKEKNDKEENKPLPNITQGRSYPVVSAYKTEHFTTPPKPYTEDTLLSAMERAGNEEYDDETEKKGLGTPATRAGIIEMLVYHGYVERQKKQLRSTDKGKALIEVVPEEIKSVKTTAEWEMQLQQIERGQFTADTFVQQITAYVVNMCDKYNSVDSTSALAQTNAPLGKCPRCNGDIVLGKYGYYCKDMCGMKIGNVFGHVLTENNIRDLLCGKSISYTVKGRKTVVLPQIEENVYQGKTSYQWIVEGNNTSSAPAATGGNKIGKCPKCNGDVVLGKYGYYCKNMCGMKVGTVYGHNLTEYQIKTLLGGKSIFCTVNGKKTVVQPQIEVNIYKGKTSYQWIINKNNK